MCKSHNDANWKGFVMLLEILMQNIISLPPSVDYIHQIAFHSSTNIYTTLTGGDIVWEVASDDDRGGEGQSE